jgi:hypothetical protein
VIGCSLYRFYDADDLLLYVGVTSAGPSRWSEHEQNRAWWDLVARTTVEHFPGRVEALAAEKAAIRAEQPKWNTMHKGERSPRSQKVRPHGTGTVILREDGRWSFIATIDGRRRWITVQTEVEAQLLQACYQHRSVIRATRDKAIAILEAGDDWDGTVPMRRQRMVKVWTK